MTSPYTILKDKVAIISGSSRDIGAEIALKLAKNGCHVVITGRTVENTLGNKISTIHTVAEQCRQYGVEALSVKCDMRHSEDIYNVVSETIKTFGKIDILVNVASEISLLDTTRLETDKYDLMQQVNIRGTYLMSQACIAYMRQSDNAHIVNLSPPLVLNAQYFNKYSAYATSKYAMSMYTLGMAHEFYHDNIAVNSLWSRGIIKTETMKRLLNNKFIDRFLWKPTIIADALIEIVTKPTKVCTGCFLIDDLVLMGAGVTNFDDYVHEKGSPIYANLFLPHDLPPPPQGITFQK